jgi:CRP-like cAMP-binding protein
VKKLSFDVFEKGSLLLKVVNSNRGFTLHSLPFFLSLDTCLPHRYGDIVPYGTAEMLFATLVILFGGLIVPAMVGGLAACVSNLNEVQAQHLAKITRVRALLRRKNYPPEQAARVLRFYNYLWSRQGGVDEVSILNELPGPLRQRVSLFIAGGALKGLPFFEGVPEAVLNSLVAMVVPRMFVPGDVIMQAGEIGKVMYVIEKGSVYVSSEDGKVELAVVGAGECFGESCLLGRAVVRSSTVKCFDYCDCFELSRLDFLDALAPFGEEQKDLIVAEVKRCFDRKLRDNDCLAKNVRNHRSKLLQRVESFHLHDMLNSNHHRNHHHHHHHDHDGAVLFPPPPPPPAAFLAASALGVDRGDNAPAPPLHASSFRSFVVKLKFSAAGLLSKLCSRAFRSIGFIRRVWSSALLCAYLYNAVAIPFRLGFLPLYSLRRFGLDYAFDALLVTDVYLCLRWFGVEEPGGGGSSSSSRWPTTNHAQVQAAYVESGRLGWDLAGSIPYDAVAAAVCLLAWSPTTVPGLEGEEDSGSGSSTSGGGALASIRLSLLLALLRLPKLLHCSKVTPLVRSLTQALYERFPHSINMTVLHLLQLLGGVLLVSHWAGCGFFALARYKNFSRACDEFASFSSSPATVPSDDVLLASTDVSIPEELSSLLNGAEWFNPNRLASPQSQCIWENTWVLLQIEESKLSPNTVPDGPGHSSGSSVSQYIRALNWALPTLVVVVIGDVLPTSSNETLYVFVSILLGMTVNAVIIGNIAGLVANLETDSAAHTARSDALSAYMHHHTVPQALQARVMQYMGSVWTHHQGETVEDEVDVLTTLPVTIQQDLAECSKLPFIQSCPFFDFCSYEVQRALAGCLETLRFSSGDVIVQCGDMGAEMFFLVQGRAKVVAADEVTVFAELGPGAFFGEQASYLFAEHLMYSSRSCLSQLLWWDFFARMLFNMFAICPVFRSSLSSCILAYLFYPLHI